MSAEILQSSTTVTWLEMKNVADYVSAVRREVDDLWSALEDATDDKPCFTKEGNKEVGRTAAFHLLQMIKCAESSLREIQHRLPPPMRAAEKPPAKLYVLRPERGPFGGGPTT